MAAATRPLPNPNPTVRDDFRRDPPLRVAHVIAVARIAITRHLGDDRPDNIQDRV